MPTALNTDWYKIGAAWRAWLHDAKVFWRFLGVIMVVCLATEWIRMSLSVPRATSLPWAGWALEIAGIGTVAYGLAKKINLYGGDSIVHRVGLWLRRCPFFRQDLKVIAGTGGFTLGSSNATAVGSIGLRDNADLEERVLRLERIAEMLESGLADLRKSTQADLEKAKTELNDRMHNLSTELESLHKISSEAHVGDVGMEFAGLGWVVFGVTFATVPEGVLWFFSPLISFFEWF